MKKREIKLIAMDMDGTLLTSSKEITEHTIEVLEAAMDRGIQIVPATGRSVNGLPKKRKCSAALLDFCIEDHYLLLLVSREWDTMDLLIQFTVWFC